MSKSHNLKIGQKVWLSSTNRQGLLETKITKVGRKYVYISRVHPSDSKFDIETLQQAGTHYGVADYLILDLEEHKKECLRDNLAIRLNTFRFDNIPLEVLININDILKPYYKEGRIF